MPEPNRIPVLAADAPPPTGPYSQAIRSGGFLFLAGQGPFRPDGSKVESSFEEQARRAFSNLRGVAAAPGPSLAGAVGVGLYRRDMSDSGAMNKVYLKFLREP